MIAEARRLVEAGGVTVNGQRIPTSAASPKDPYLMSVNDIIASSISPSSGGITTTTTATSSVSASASGVKGHCLVRTGKKNFFIVKIIE
jgi:ribosomal protein S4